MPTSEYPKTLSDPTGTQVPDRTVNTADEEAAARTAGFTVVVPNPVPSAPVVAASPVAVSVDAPDITGLLQQLKDLHPPAAFPVDDAARADMKAKSKQRDEVIQKLDQIVIEMEQLAATSADPTSVANAKKNADVLRQQINNAKYVK